MKLHSIIKEIPTKYMALFTAAEKLAVGEVLPVECEDGRERKQVFDFLRYHFPEIRLVSRDKFLYASKGDFNAVRYPAKRTKRNTRREAARERGFEKILRPTRTPLSRRAAD